MAIVKANEASVKVALETILGRRCDHRDVQSWNILSGGKTQGSPWSYKNITTTGFACKSPANCWLLPATLVHPVSPQALHSTKPAADWLSKGLHCILITSVIVLESLESGVDA